MKNAVLCGRHSWRASLVLFAAIGAAGTFCAGAKAQTVPHPSAIPAGVRPGAIEAQFDKEIAPDVTADAAVLSPYEPEQPAEGAAISFVLRQVIVEGAVSVDQSEISALYADRIGQEIRLAEVFDFARKITTLYADKGYPLSLAYVPVQEIEDGVVRIRVIEGFVASAEAEAESAALKRRLTTFAENISAERPLTNRTLERTLLLANETPGTKVTGVLSRDETADGIRMTLAGERKRFAAAVNLNNRASRAVGREQAVARVAMNGVLSGFDQLGLAAVQSLNADELTVLSGKYSTVLSPSGLTLNLSATRSEAAPGIPFLRVLAFETQGWTASAGVSYPAILSRNTRLHFAATGSWKEFRSAFGATPNTLDRLWTTDFDAALSIKDSLKGTNAIALTVSRGWNVFDATEPGSPLASRAGAGGQFVSVIADLSRTQVINDWADMTIGVKGQTTNNPLLSSEQCGFGGAGFGRGYDPFEIAGDRCVVALVELRASPSFLDRGWFKAQPFVSFDAGAVRQLGPLAVGEPRTASLYSLAAGARFSVTKHVSIGTEIGVPLKGTVAQEGDDDPRFFFSLEASY